MNKIRRHFKRNRRNVCCATMFFIILLFVYIFKVCLLPYKQTEYPIIVWWTPNFSGYDHKISKCEHGYNCIFRSNRNSLVVKQAMGFLFYGSEFIYYDLPLPRNNKIVWGLLHEESPRNTPILSHELTLNLFNYSSTISRFSHVPLTLQYLHIDGLLKNDFFIDTPKKNKLLLNLAPVLYIQTDCDTSSYRDSYVQELMKYISIDSYGACLNNKKLPDAFKIDYLNNLYSDEFLKFVSQYKFTIAIENGICYDYITEKLWRPLQVGSVPIYMGSPSVRDWLPNNKSAIIINEYNSPKKLAEHIIFLNTHDGEYNKYLQHKTNTKIENLNLIKFLRDNDFNMEIDDKQNSFVDKFECFVCLKVHNNIRNYAHTESIIDKSHYNCMKPIPIWKELKPNWWLDMWYTSEKEAIILNKLVVNEKRNNFTKEEFQSKLNLLSNN